MSVRERMRIGRALRELPAIEQAFVAGQLGEVDDRERRRRTDDAPAALTEPSVAT